MPAQESDDAQSGEPETPEETHISIQTGVYTGMLMVAAGCMAAAVAFTYFSQAFYEVDGKKLKLPVHPKTGEAGFKSAKPSAIEEETEDETEPAQEEKKEEAAPAEEEKKEEAAPAEEEKKEEAAPAEEKKDEKPAEEKKEE